jgi:hypothetical protein
MNSVKNLDTDYLRSSRTIETILVSNSSAKKLFYIYNYEGYSFRVFESSSKLRDFFESDVESEIHFTNESELDYFFLYVTIK